MRPAGVLALFLLLAFAGAPGAQAATVTANDRSGVVFLAAPGERNVVTIDRDGPLGSLGVVVRDTGGALLVPGDGCVFAGLDTAVCIGGQTKARHHAELGDGDDTARITLYRASVEGGPGDDAITTGPGINDTVRAGPGDDAVTDLGGGGDALYYDERQADLTIDLAAGGGGEPGENDTITGFERLYAGSGDDTISGGDGLGIAGGPGADRLSVASGAVEGGEGDDVLDGGPGSTRLDGGPGADRVEGGAGDDVLDGGPGRAAAGGGSDADLVDGGAGADSVSYYGHAGGVNVDLDGVADDGEAGEGDDVRAIETVTGTPLSDMIDLSASVAGVLIQAWEGDDVIRGSAGGETIYAGDGDDVVDAGGGDDFVVDALAAAGEIHGGSGFDAYAVGFRAVTVSLDDVANDGVLSHPVRTANIHSDVEKIFASYGPDVLEGNARAQVFVGLGASDRLAGMGGDDVLFGDCEVANCFAQGDDVIDGGEGDDSLHGGPFDDSLDGGPGADAIRCGEGIDANVPDPMDTLVEGCET